MFGCVFAQREGESTDKCISFLFPMLHDNFALIISVFIDVGQRFIGQIVGIEYEPMSDCVHRSWYNGETRA